MWKAAIAALHALRIVFIEFHGHVFGRNRVIGRKYILAVVRATRGRVLDEKDILAAAHAIRSRFGSILSLAARTRRADRGDNDCYRHD